MSEAPLLYIEDEETDVMLMRLGLQKARIPDPLITVADGEEAIAYLSGTGHYSDRQRYPIPSLVFLDLNLPRLAGMKVLEWIRQQPQYANLPVVIYTSSGQPADRDKARHLGANDYLVKPSLIDTIAEMVKKVKERWLYHSPNAYEI